MELAKLVCGANVEQYRKIECTNGHILRFSDEELDDGEEIQMEEDRTSLLVKGNIREVELQNMSETRSCRTHETSTLTWKPSSNASKQKMELRIHKMDNTSFTVEVPKKATLLGLKNALREKFDTLGCQISWPHVWGHFCLTFNTQKLLDDSISLQMLGIGNSDELYFVRHLSLSSQSGRRSGFFRSMRKKSA